MLFYPAHDLSLANGIRHYNPPLAARQLQSDLASIFPLWQPHENLLHPLPWGWNYDTRASLLKRGIPADCLPSDEDLYKLRDLSHRRHTISMLQSFQALSEKHPFLSFKNISLPQYICDNQSLRIAIDQTPSCLLKAPWSSSGRGLVWSDKTAQEKLLQRGESIIRDMGGVMFEQCYDKALDFAMLFYIGNKKVRFVGYSIFDTDQLGTYRSGLLMSHEKMADKLSNFISAEELEIVCQHYSNHLLPQMFSSFFDQKYQLGYIGIDMMMIKDPTMPLGYRLHPCIEMNVRCTMGVVARLLFDHFIHPEACGQYIIEYSKETKFLQQRQQHLCDSNPLCESDNRILSGFLPLSTIEDDSHFFAYALLNSSK